jgi:hypothetical protein
VKLRLSLLVFTLLLLGVNSWSLNQNSDSDIATKATIAMVIFCLSAICLCLALQSLNGLGAIKMFAFLSPFVLFQTIVNIENVETATLLSLDVIFLAILLLPATIDLLTRSIGVENERIFTLQIPNSITISTTIVWSYFWVNIYFLILNFRTSQWLFVAILSIVAIFILLFFFATTLNLIHRRIVIVPNGIVICDPLTLTDTILLPLSKLKDIKTIKKQNLRKSLRQYGPKKNEYSGNLNSKHVSKLTLTEQTDSFIIRKTHVNTERKDVDTLYIALVNGKKFEKYFRARFHNTNSQPVKTDPRKEKLELLKMEKELGIETAPRSDAKLPQWRTKKKKSDDNS